MKFSIRDLLLITVIVAVSLGWLVDHWRAAARDAAWERQFEEAMDKLSIADGREHVFDTPGGPWSVNRKPDPESQKREVIHICDWHRVERAAFAADLMASGTDYTQEEIANLYSEHLDDVEAVQAEQVEQLRALIRQHNLKHVWVEGVTPEILPVFCAIVDTVKGAKEPNREILLRIGAPGRLLALGELVEVLPLDDERTYSAARPLKNGQIDPNSESFAARDNAMATKLLSTDDPVCVIVLGAGHNLASKFDGKRVEYKRTMSKRVQQLLESQP